MRIAPVDLGYLIDRSTELCARVAEAWEDQPRDAAGRAGPEVVATGLDHLFAVLQRIEEPMPAGPPGRLSATELRDLATYGVGLLSELAACARKLGMDREAGAAEALTVPFSVLMAREGAELSALEPVVNALAALANGLSDPAELAQLFGLMGEIMNAVSVVLTQDMERNDPQRPWRILLLNRAIVATRSHRPNLMATAFDAIVEHLPEEAARFFEEGMAQMDILDYPPHVRDVMERYYLRQGPAPRTLH